MAAIKDFTISDLAAATFTAYKADGSVDLDAVDGHAADLVAHGVKYAFINGTTGDSMSLSDQERKDLAAAWTVAGRKHGVTIVNHIGCNSITAAKELAAHSASVGCAAISAMPPTFFKAASPVELARWLQAISSAAPELPMYYYNFSVITGVVVDPLALLKAAEEIGYTQLRGMKFTDFNLFQYDACVRHRGGYYDMLYGRDEAMLGGLATGAKASIGNAFNFNTGIYRRIRAAFAAGDMATALKEQSRANDVISLLASPRFGGNFLVTSRHLCAIKHANTTAKGKGPAGARPLVMGPPRAPHVPMTAAQTAALEAELEAMGFWDFCD